MVRRTLGRLLFVWGLGAWLTFACTVPPMSDLGAGACEPGVHPCGDGLSCVDGWCVPGEAGEPAPDGGGATVDSGSGDLDGGADDAGLVVDGGTDAGFDGVTGVQFVRMVTPASEEDVPVNLTNAAIAAFHLSDGGFVGPLPGQGRFDGTFQIPKVPAGEYYLKFGDIFLITSQRHVDFTTAMMGRTGAQPITQGPTNIVLNAPGLEPWESNDLLQVSSMQLGMYRYGVPFSSGGPTIGTTALSGATFDLEKFYEPQLMSQAAGDELVAMQLTQRSTSGINYLAVTRSVTASLDVQQASDTSMNGVFTQPQAKTLSFTLQPGAFISHAATVYPTAASTEENLGVIPIPMANDYGNYDNCAWSVWMDSKTGTVDVPLSFTYGDAFPGVDELVVYKHWLSTNFKAQGASSSINVRGGFWYELRPADLNNGVLAPVLTPPRALRINDQDAHLARSGISQTPLLSWTAPEVGSPDLYEVVVFRIYASGNDTSSAKIAHLYTPNTHLRIPPGLLAQGETYYFRVWGSTSPADRSARPLLYALPMYSAGSFTALVSP